MHQGAGLLEIAVAGHILSGSTPDKTIKKEIKEELFGGKSPSAQLKIKKIGSYFHSDLPNNNEIAHLYEIIYSGAFSGSEESEGKAFWVDLKKLIDDMSNNPEKYARYSITALNEYSKLS